MQRYETGADADTEAPTDPDNGFEDDYRTTVQLCPTTGVLSQQIEQCPNVQEALGASLKWGRITGGIGGAVLGMAIGVFLGTQLEQWRRRR